MKTGLKLLAALALVAGVGMAADGVYAACSGEGHLGYPIVQCGNRTWFGTPPAGSGAISVVWWELGFGNIGVNSGAGTNGQGFVSPNFNGNDSGLATAADLDFVDAQFVGGPPGAMCFSSATNWIAGGIDGCADNIRDGAVGTYLAYNRDDNLLNKYFDGRGPGYPDSTTGTRDYLVDNPMAVLLKESNNKSFALAFLANLTRNGNPLDGSEGSFQFRTLINGDNNLQSEPTVVPWQPIPNPNISATFSIPGDTTSDRILNMTWTPVRLVHDGSNRPSTDTSIFPDSANGGNNGVGVLNQGRLVRYVVESVAMDAGGNCPTTWGAIHTTGNPNATVTVPQNTCVRLTSAFGRTPTQTVVNVTNARRGQLGDLGYNVSSDAIKIGGTLTAQKVTITSAKKAGGNILVEFSSSTELSVSRFGIYGIDNRGKATLLGSANCSFCTSGLGGGYSVSVKGAGVKSVYVVMEPSGEKSAEVAVK
jgi:hypothetical protein